MATIGNIWRQMDTNGNKRQQIDTKWIQIDTNGYKWLHRETTGNNRQRMDTKWSTTTKDANHSGESGDKLLQFFLKSEFKWVETESLGSKPKKSKKCCKH